MRATLTVALVAALLVAGCGTRACKPGTVLVTVEFAGGTAAANAVDVSLAVDGNAPMTRPVARTPGGTSGTIEVSFATAYPTGHTLALTIVARQDATVLGEGSASLTATATCDDVKVTLGATDDMGLDGGSDLGDGGGGDLGPVVPQAICSVDHWCWVNPLPTGNGMVGTFGFSPTDVWAVGSAGTILHWDGKVWKSYAGATQADLWSVWGVAPNDVWAGGAGVLVHFDGTSWTVKLNEATPNDTFVSIWGAASNNVYAASANTTVQHWDGNTWTAITIDPAEAISSVSGTGAGDVWALGNKLWHSTGGAFTVAATPAAGSHPISVYAPAAGNAWLVGLGGYIAQFANNTLTPTTGVTPKALQIVWGTGASDIWAAGSQGALVHWNGTAWNASYSTGTTAFLWGGWSASASDLWVVGDNGTIIESNGSTFTPRSNGFVTPLAAVWGSAANDVWTVGRGGKIYHYDGTSWSSVASGTSNDLLGVWGSAANDVWAVGLAGTVLHWTGSANGWQSVSSTVTYDLGSVWGSRSNDVWAVGTLTNTTASTAAPIIHWNGSAWSGGYTYSTGLVRSTLNGVYGADIAGHVWAVGNDTLTTGPESTFASYPGSGTVWTVSTVANTSNVAAVWAGSFTTFAVGSTSIYSWNGTTWSATATPNQLQLYGMYGFADNDIYAVDNAYGAPTVLHWNGSVWTPQVAGVDYLTNVWGSSPTDIWAVGNGGAILHKTQ